MEYRFGSYDEAIKALQSLKKQDEQGKERNIFVFTIDFDNESESKKIATPDEGCLLVGRSKSIIVNEDEFIPQMQLYSTKQSNIRNIKKEGVMHNIIYGKRNK